MRCIGDGCVVAALLLCSASAQELPRRTFKFGAIVTGDEGLRTSETHGECVPTLPTASTLLTASTHLLRI